ncbi:MAG TPA: DUF4097 family beta strand repeat-containing protein [Candidatus Bathyarchaeia archaeon]|nr:DUF4097 family beta strand repeat-containing protein [Candidatus Bathyarchaeia archaeon]
MTPHPKSRLRIPAALILAAAAFLPGDARADGDQGIMDRVGSLFEDVPRLLDLVGEKALDVIGPGLGFGDVEESGGFNVRREFEEAYPVSPGAVISIGNEFGAGEVRVSTWDNQVVRIAAAISVAAETSTLATEIAEGVEIRVTPPQNGAPSADKLAEVRTVLPDLRDGQGKPSIEVNYVVTIPRNVGITVRNDFGDTLLTGIGGAVAVDSRYGAVSLRNCSGSVHVRSRGEFPVQAQGLRQGGTFDLHYARAEFADIAGVLQIKNFWGSVALRGLGVESDTEVSCESGPVYLQLTENVVPDLEATVLFGSIESDLDLTRAAHGNVTIARSPSMESRQQIVLRTTFAPILIQAAGQGQLPAASGVLPDYQPFKEVASQTYTLPEQATITVRAVAGDIRITGVDDTQTHLTTTKFVRVQSQANVRAALQALDAAILTTDTGLTLTTAVKDNMAALGCTSYKIDILIECPRTVSLDVQAANGHTAIDGIGGNVVARQEAGSVAVEHVKGLLDLANQKGDIQVAECAGPVTATAYFGHVTMKNVYGKMTTTCIEGKTVIEAPHAEIEATNSGGDVRIISFDGISGNYTVTAEQGNISILLPPETDATLTATAEFGVVRSSIPLTGNKKKDFEEFTKPGTGPYRVTLKTRHGDILLD